MKLLFFWWRFLQVQEIILILQSPSCSFMPRCDDLPLQSCNPGSIAKENHKYNQYNLSVHIIRLLNGSLICTCRISWMLNLCFTVVGDFFLYFSSFLQPVNICSKLNLYFAPPGILSLKFPETPTVKAASFFFVGWRWNVQISDFILSCWCDSLHFFLWPGRQNCCLDAKTPQHWLRCCTWTGTCWLRPSCRWVDRLVESSSLLLTCGIQGLCIASSAVPGDWRHVASQPNRTFLWSSVGSEPPLSSSAGPMAERDTADSRVSLCGGLLRAETHL